MSKLVSILILVLFINNAIAQSGDCHGAQVIVDKSSVSFVIGASENQESDNLGEGCSGQEEYFSTDDGFSSHWFSWEIFKSGTLTFELSKDIDDYDLDFIVFKGADTTVSCSNLNRVRCMFSGVTFDVESESCLGATGLNLVETDLFENPGCSFGDNNYLRYLDAVEGEVYHLLVVDFDLSDTTSKLQICGSALLGEDDEACTSLSVEEVNRDNNVSVYPNPVLDHLTISNKSEVIRKIEVFDHFGKLIIIPNMNQPQDVSLDVSNLNAGQYFAQVYTDNNVDIVKFLKL